MCAFVGIYLI